MKRLIYLAQFTDAAGYASAARGYLHVFDQLASEEGFEFHIFNLPFEKSHRLKDSEQRLIDKYQIKGEAHLNQLLQEKYTLVWHIPPAVISWIESANNLPIHMRKVFIRAKRLLDAAEENINISTWEADKIPDFWVKVLSRLKTEFCFVPCRWNEETYNKANVKTKLLPHYIPIDARKFKSDPFPLPNLKDKFTFLTISQWNHRKAFDVLLRAYFSEFKDQQDVALIIKTYIDNMSVQTATPEEQYKIIANHVNTIKSQVYIDDSNNHPTAPVVLINEIISPSEISHLYDVSDCFVLPTRGEGFGLTIADAVARKIPVIVPNKGGHIDYLHDNEFLFECYKSPCHNVQNYLCDMNYYEPNILDLMSKMRSAYNVKKQNIAVFDKVTKLNYKKLSAHCSSANIRKILKDSLKLESCSDSRAPTNKIKHRTQELKKELQSVNNLQQKIGLLKDAYKGETCYLLSCGPSLKKNSASHLKNLLSDKLVFSVKQAYDYCPEIADFHFFNCSNLPHPRPDVHYPYDESDPISVVSSNYDLEKRFAPQQEVDLFFKIPIRTEIANKFLVFTKEFEKYCLENSIERPCGPGIVLETVLHMAVHLGVSKIVAAGYDLSKENPKEQSDHKHFYGETDKLFNRADVLPWEVKAHVDATEEIYNWLLSRGVQLELASAESALFEGIPRVSL